MGWEILQAFAVLIVVVIIFFLAWYIPHIIAKRGNFSDKGKNIAILEKVPVSKDSYIMLLKTFDKVMVVGVTPGGMTNLRELDNGDYKPEDIEQSTPSFSKIFKAALRDTVPEGRLRNAFDRFAARHGKGGEKGEGGEPGGGGDGDGN
jgi:flagellar protein FliO/FliZ